MIKELVQFVKDVPESVKKRAMEPKAGLHILIGFDEEGNGKVVESERFERSGEISPFISNCLDRLKYAWMINEDTNKCLSKTKDIHSVSPFCFGFKRESWKGGDYFALNKQGKSKPGFNERIEDYFLKCIEPPYNDDETVKQMGLQFKVFLKENLERLLDQFDLSDLLQKEYIIIYREVDFKEYQQFYASYLAEKLFNTSEYNIEVAGEILGTSNFYNGFNSKKPFLTHQTASFDITSRISAEEAKALSEFQVHASKKLFPNPTPIFIDKPELTKDAIKLFHRAEDQKTSHREIISELWNREKDLGNYYLLYFVGGAIQDFDYVSKFKYLLSDNKNANGEPLFWQIENITEIKNKEKILQPSIQLKSVFDFERIVIRQLFNNALVKIDDKKGTISMRYLDDMDAKWYRPAMFSLLLKYRKPVYDFIYKSMRSGIRGQQFYDICMSGIMDDIRNHDSKREYAIKSKLNIYISLNQHFDENTKIMPSKIRDLKNQLIDVLQADDKNYDSVADAELFAFGAGQLIYYLLYQSESSDKSHALIEPFLQKTTVDPFKKAIEITFAKYKHKLGRGAKRVNKLLAETLGFPLIDGQLRDLKTIMLTGYFSPNIFLQSSKKTDSPS